MASLHPTPADTPAGGKPSDSGVEAARSLSAHPALLAMVEVCRHLTFALPSRPRVLCMVEIKARALHMLGRYYTIKLTSPAFLF